MTTFLEKSLTKKKLAILFALLLSGTAAIYYLSLGDCGYMEINQLEQSLNIYTNCDVIVTVDTVPNLDIEDSVVYLTIPEDWKWQVIPK